MDGRRWGKWLKSMYGIKDVSSMKNADGSLGGAGVVIVDHGVRRDVLTWILGTDAI